MSEPDGRIPTYIRIDAARKKLSEEGKGFYIPKTGDRTTGLILLHLNNLDGKNILLTEQRNLDGILKWTKLHKEDFLENMDIPSKIEKHTSFDEDLWVIEIEDRDMINPFD